MPQRDKIHSQVKAALENEGWLILHDPLFVPVEGLAGLYIDLQAENVWSAYKGEQQIVVEVKDFTGQSFTKEFYESIGQVLVYRKALENRGVSWPVFMAMPSFAYHRIQKVPLFISVLKEFSINLLIIDIDLETIQSWIERSNTGK